MSRKCNGFDHTRVTIRIIATVCRCCNVALAFSPNPELLMLVEKNHACRKRQLE
jgi:hypothetical protein